MSMTSMNDGHSRRAELLIVIGLALGATATRVPGLWQWDFVVDEWSTFFDSAKGIPSFINPAYYGLTFVSFQLFGESEWSARLPAMLLGVAAVPVFYVAWKNIIGWQAAVIGSILIVISSWHLWYSQFARAYSGVFLMGLLAYYFYFVAIRSNSLKYFIIFLLVAALGVSFHLTSVAVLAACGLYSLVLLVFGRSTAQGYSRRIAGIHVGLAVAAVPVAVYFLWPILEGWYEGYQAWAWGYGSLGVALQIPKYVQLPVAVSALIGAILMTRSEPWKAVFFWIGIGVPALLLVLGAAALPVRPDYMFYAAPLIYALSGYTCDRVRRALSGTGIGAHALTAVIVISMLPEAVSHYTGRATHDVREAIKFIESVYQPGDRIYSHFPFNHYASDSYEVHRGLGNPYNNTIDWAAALQEYQEGGRRTWILLPLKRKPLAKKLERWLLSNARLVWRSYSTRLDYTFEGYQIFLVEPSGRTRSEGEIRRSQSLAVLTGAVPQCRSS